MASSAARWRSSMSSQLSRVLTRACRAVGYRCDFGSGHVNAYRMRSRYPTEVSGGFAECHDGVAEAPIPVPDQSKTNGGKQLAEADEGNTPVVVRSDEVRQKRRSDS